MLNVMIRWILCFTINMQEMKYNSVLVEVKVDARSWSWWRRSLEGRKC